MDVNATNIEEIVRQVLNSMEGHTGAGKSVSGNVAGEIPKTARVAMLTSLEHYDIKEFPIPEVGDDDILVKVEGCGICGTDAHEFKKDPFGLIPVANHRAVSAYRHCGCKKSAGVAGLSVLCLPQL